jgi:hypothetical protein
MRAGNVRGRCQIKCDLMTGGALNMKRDATPDTGGRAVDMAEEHEVRHARALKDLPFFFGVLEPEGVHVRQAEVERRMMLEQKQRLVARRIRQRLLEERKTPAAQPPGMNVPALAERIECEDRRVIEVPDRLHKSIAVVIRFLEHGAERLAAIVIAHHQHDRDSQSCQPVFERFISTLLAPMGEIARQDQEGKVVVVAADRVERGRKSRSRIERIETTAGRNEVRVGQDNKLHLTDPLPG